MTKKSHYYIRKTHRYLGVFIGIQFLLWTIGGLYFSWNNLDDVHGDHLRKLPHYLSANDSLVSPTVAIANLKAFTQVDSINTIRLITVLHNPVYQVSYFKGHTGEGLHANTNHALADARTGEIRPALTEQEAVLVAKENILPGAEVSQVRLLSNTDGHHEYREKPLPAWAVDFKEPRCTVYISAELGTFQSIRHNQWRTFDFFWMLHTMDYETRDNIGNLVLRSFSILGLVTVVSGFLLFFVSGSLFKKSR